MNRIATIGLALALCPAAAFAQGSAARPVNTAASSTVPAADAEFARTAASGGMAEVQAGRLAASHGTGPVKAIGQQMVTEHGKVNMQLMAIAKAKGMSLPAQPDEAHTATLAELGKTTGKAFNDMYLTGQIADHQNTIEMFQTEAAQGTDPDLKAFASKTLPGLQQHFGKIKAAAGKTS